MTLAEFVPENPLEHAIMSARRGTLTVDALLLRLANVPLFISSRAEVMEDGRGFEPLLIEESGNALVAAFSSIERPSLHKSVAGYVLKMPGRDFFVRLPSLYGVIVNPGYVAQLVISPDSVADLRRLLKAESALPDRTDAS